MGNCQAIDTATLVIQHPSGKVDKLYWPVNASEIMKMNPGHCVALLISTTISSTPKENNKTLDFNHNNTPSSVRLTRIKLLRPTDTLVLGRVYRLITTQEVMKGLRAKKQAKMKKNPLESDGKTENFDPAEKEGNKAIKYERKRGKTSSGTASSSTSWQPSLQSILEAGT